MTLDCEIVVTPSGEKAVRDRGTGEIMHPAVGPRLEAARLYVEPSRLAARLRAPDPVPLVLFDVGLGAGSNAIAAWTLSETLAGAARRLEIVSFDRSLAALELALRPEHAAAFGFEGAAAAAARRLLESGRHDAARTDWSFVEGDARSTLARRAPRSADVVFWDPFSPYANPELWTCEIFCALRRLCRREATVHTYSRATATRSALLLAGFAVGETDAVPETRPGTVASVEPCALARPLDRSWLERLEQSRARFPADAPPDALERIRAAAQFLG